MQDRVGAQIPTPEEIAQITADLKAIHQRLAPYLVNLSDAERQAALKMRLGGEPIAVTTASLARKHNVQLPEATPDGLQADLQLAQRLAPVAEQLAAVRQAVDDTITEAKSECWWAVTALYSTLCRISSGHPELEAEIRPLRQFFARRRQTLEK